MSGTIYRLFVTITPGLEHLLEQELAELCPGAKCQQQPGGVELKGDQPLLWRLALCSRLAESVRVRLGQPFAAQSFDELEQGLTRLSWAAFLPQGAVLPQLRVRCHRSRLYHTDAVRERAEATMARVLEGRLSADGGESQEGRIHLRLERDRCQVSLEATGEPLHRRGYRKHVGQAPLRETLAAACLRAAAYDGRQPLWDPLCGSGTLALEALLMARRSWPGLAREFAFQRWPTHDASGFAELRQELSGAAVPGAVVIASDHDARALRAARANAAAAGLSGQLTLERGDLQAVAPRVPKGAMVLTNPPYGHRLDRGVKKVQQRLGGLLRRRPDLRPVFVLTASRDLPRDSRLAWEPVLQFRNRGLPVRLLRLEG